MSLVDSLLAQTIDDHVQWMGLWLRAALYEKIHVAQAEMLQPPASFTAWRTEATKSMKDQAAIARLSSQFDHLHRFARLSLMQAPEGAPLSRLDYDLVIAKYVEFIRSLHRVERALATAESGLDTLTGLRSRAGMKDDLNRELARYHRTEKPFCIAIMDIDYFKTVNDTYGHDNGDKVLSSVANYIEGVIRPFDDAWRWGGEEILICLKEVDMHQGRTVLERVRSGLEKLPIRLLNGKEINVTASFGLSSVSPSATIETMISVADKALYTAKAAGRNRISQASKLK